MIFTKIFIFFSKIRMLKEANFELFRLNYSSWLIPTVWGLRKNVLEIVLFRDDQGL